MDYGAIAVAVAVAVAVLVGLLLRGNTHTYLL